MVVATTPTTNGTATVPAPPPTPSAKARLKTWVREQVEGKGEVRAPDVAVRAKEHFVHDRTFLAELGEQMLPTMIYEIVLDVIGEGRQDAGSIDTVSGATAASGSTDSRAALKRRLDLLQVRYSRWMEHVGDGHINLLKLTAETCQKAIDIRTERGDHEHRVAAFLMSLKAGIKAGKTVGESLNLEQIEFIRRAKMEPKGD